MSATLFPLSRPLSVGEVLDAGFRLFRATVLVCLPFASLGVVAGQLPGFYSVIRGGTPGAAAFHDTGWVVLYACSTLLTLFLVGAIFVQQHRMGAGEPRGLRFALRDTLRRMPALFALVLLLVAAAGAAAVLVMLLGGAIGLIWAALLCTLPLVYAAVSLLFAWPAVLIDKRTALAALRSSAQLVGGHRLRTALVMLAALGALLVFYSIAIVLGLIVATLLGSTDLAVVAAVTTLMLVVLGAVGVPFYTALIIAAYEDLKLRRQGADLERRIEDMRPR